MTTGATIHTTEGLKMTVTRRTKPPVIPNLEMKVVSDSQEPRLSTPTMVVSAATVASGEDQRELSWFCSFKLHRHTEWVCSLRSPQSYNLVTYFSKLFWFSMCICSHFLMFLPFFGIFLLKDYLGTSIYIALEIFDLLQHLVVRAVQYREEVSWCATFTRTRSQTLPGLFSPILQRTPTDYRSACYHSKTPWTYLQQVLTSEHGMLPF